LETNGIICYNDITMLQSMNMELWCWVPLKRGGGV